MGVLSKASILRVANLCGPALTEYKIIGVLVENRWVKNEDDFYQKGADYVTGLSHSKAAKIEAILLYFNGDTTVLAASAALLSAAAKELFRDPPNFDDLNRSLGLDGYVYDSRKGTMVPIVGQAEKEAETQTELQERLRKLDPKFSKMEQGIWDAISSGGADNLRHAVSSSRELLNQVIDRLVGGNPDQLTRRQRIEKILGSKSTAKVVDAIAGLVNELYSSMSTLEHTEPDLDTTVLTAKMTEYSLLFILRKIDS